MKAARYLAAVFVAIRANVVVIDEAVCPPRKLRRVLVSRVTVTTGHPLRARSHLAGRSGHMFAICSVPG